MRADSVVNVQLYRTNSITDSHMNEVYTVLISIVPNILADNISQMWYRLESPDNSALTNQLCGQKTKVANVRSNVKYGHTWLDEVFY